MSKRFPNPKDRLFIGQFPTGTIFADRANIQGGDYKTVAFLSDASGQLAFRRSCPEVLKPLIRDWAEKHGPKKPFADVPSSPALSIEDFLNRYYKPERYTGRGEEYAKALLTAHQADFERDGFDIISHHDSVTGRVVIWRGK